MKAKWENSVQKISHLYAHLKQQLLFGCVCAKCLPDFQGVGRLWGLLLGPAGRLGQSFERINKLVEHPATHRRVVGENQHRFDTRHTVETMMIPK